MILFTHIVLIFIHCQGCYLTRARSPEVRKLLVRATKVLFKEPEWASIRFISRLKNLLASKLIIVVSVSQEAGERRKFAVNYMKEIAHTAILIERKKKKLNEILPEVFCKMVHSAVTDLNDLDAFMKDSFERIKNK